MNGKISGEIISAVLNENEILLLSKVTRSFNNCALFLPCKLYEGVIAGRCSGSRSPPRTRSLDPYPSSTIESIQLRISRNAPRYAVERSNDLLAQCRRVVHHGRLLSRTRFANNFRRDATLRYRSRCRDSPQLFRSRGNSMKEPRRSAEPPLLHRIHRRLHFGTEHFENFGGAFRF